MDFDYISEMVIALHCLQLFVAYMIDAQSIIYWSITGLQLVWRNDCLLYFILGYIEIGDYINRG